MMSPTMPQHSSRALSFLLVALLASISAVRAAEPAPVFTRAQLREDLGSLEKILGEMHPDPGYTIDPAALEEGKRRIAAELESGEPMTRDEAWRLFSTLNPLFADAHLLVTLPDWRGAARAHLAAGKKLFPFEVHVSRRGELTVLSALGGAAEPLAGSRLERINGVAADQVVATLLSHVPGETPAFRAGILSQRFWFYYWKVYGAPDVYVIKTSESRRIRRVSGGAALPVTLADEESFDRLFRFSILPGDSALLSVGSFVWEDKARFLAFTQDAFRKMKLAGTRTLIIDIRGNTGGNDDMWKEGILAYIATQPYRWASHYRKRVGSPDPARNEKAGDLVDGELQTWVPPEPDNPAHFAGKVYVLMGPATYSSSIVFSVVMQDFGFGTLVSDDADDCVRASQTGGTRTANLPNSGLTVVVPRFVLYRPSGERLPVLLRPDMQVAGDPLNPVAAVDDLLRKSHSP